MSTLNVNTSVHLVLPPPPLAYGVYTCENIDIFGWPLTNIEINGMDSVMGWNVRLVESRISMEEYNVCKVWEQKCENESDANRVYAN